MDKAGIAIMGARGSLGDVPGFLAKVGQLETHHSATIQFFRADRVFGAEHLLSATEKACRAIKNGTAMSKTLGMEIMLYAAAERQTSEALRKIGIFDGVAEMGAVVVGNAPPDMIFKELGIKRDDSVLGPAGKDISIFGMTPEEMNLAGETVADLVLEKVALSEVMR
jgi:KEOPS complex subunit Cgi121